MKLARCDDDSSLVKALEFSVKVGRTVVALDYCDEGCFRRCGTITSQR